MADLPVGYAYAGEPHFIEVEDVNGVKIGYYSQTVKAPTGEVIIGCAANPSAARDVAVVNARQHFEIHTMAPNRRLWYEIDKAKKNGRFYSGDLVTVIEIIAQMVSPRHCG